MQPRSRGTGRKEARNWYVFHAAPRPIYRGSSRRNFKRGLTYARVCMCAYTYGNVYLPGVVMELCEKQRSLLPLLLLSILLCTFGNLRGHKVFRRLILSYSITRARATVFYKGVARDAQRGMGGGHRWKIEFRPWGPVGWSMLTVGKFAFNRARTRHQASEYPRENLFSFFLSFLFLSEILVTNNAIRAMINFVRMRGDWTYREAPSRDDSSRSNAGDVYRVWRTRRSSRSPCNGWTVKQRQCVNKRWMKLSSDRENIVWYLGGIIAPPI